MKRHSQKKESPMTAASDELLLLQSQLLAKEEEAKMKQERLSRALKEKLARVKQNNTLKLHKIQTQWQTLLDKAKEEELRQGIMVLKQAFEHEMECKDKVIELLVTDLEQADEQHAQALRSHTDNVDRLLELQRCHLALLEEAYGAQLQDLEMQFESERRSILKQQERESRYLQAMATATEQNFTKNNHEAELNFKSVRHNTKNENQLEKERCHRELSGKVKALREQLQHITQNHVEVTKREKMAIKKLQEKNRMSSKEIEMQAKKLQKLQDLVRTTEAQLLARRREYEEQNQHWRKEREKSFRRLQELKGEMKKARASAHKRLVALLVQSDAALKVLTQVVNKAQRILKLAEMCRRLETEEEKVLPFYPSSPAEDEQRDTQRILEELPTESLPQATGDYVRLERFWQRFNKVKLEEKALERELAALRQENRRPRELLQRYLAGSSVTQEVLSGRKLLHTTEHKNCVPRDSSRTWGTKRKVGRVQHTPTPSRTPSSALPALNPPAERGAQPAAQGRHRDHKRLELP